MAMEWQNASVLVTGATGLVGSWLVSELLERKCSVSALVIDDDPQSEFYRTSVNSKCRVVSGALESRRDVERLLGLAEPEVVFHLGAQTIVGTAQRFPFSTFEANVRGSYTLFEACRSLGESLKALVVASSDKVYGDAEEYPTTEAAPLEARGPYDVSKVCTDVLPRCYVDSFGLPIGIARCGNIYGGGDLNFSRIVPGTIRSLQRNEAPVIRSDGTLIRDYFFVRDAVSAYINLAEGVVAGKARSGAYNFSNHDPLSVIDLVKRISTVMTVDTAPEVLGKAQGEIARQTLDSTRARQELGWSPKYSLNEGLQQTVEWYSDYSKRENA